MFLLVGLGNPGPQYEATRHNVGFLLLDEIAVEARISFSSIKFRGLFGRGNWNGVDVALLKPQTFMNLSGAPVLEALQFFKLDQQQLVVVFDDLDQAHGAVKMRLGGGHGGHNGMRDILAKLPSDGFHRLKIGIDKPSHKAATADYVLGKFSEPQWNSLKEETFPTAKKRLLETLRRAK